MFWKSITNSEYYGKNFEEKILYATVYWFLHLVSDMAGSSGNPGKGTGIPGPVLSFAKVFSTLPCFKSGYKDETAIRNLVSKLFNGTLLAERHNGKISKPQRFDLRAEIGLLHEPGKQTIPIIVNESLTRSFYFLHRLYLELSRLDRLDFDSLVSIDAKSVLPFNNKVIRRMVTVSSGTFALVDISDAAIRSYIKNRTIEGQFVVDFALRVNFVGVGCFVVAFTKDVRSIYAEAKLKEKALDEVTLVEEEILHNLFFTESQFRILYSIERRAVEYDIYITKKGTVEKYSWLEQWQEMLLSTLNGVLDKDTYFYNEKELSSAIKEELENSNSDIWLKNMALEIAFFEPYVSLEQVDSTKALKREKKSDYILNIFAQKNYGISACQIKDYRAIYRKYSEILDGTRNRKNIGLAGTAIATVATGGLAFGFAPVVAPLLAGTFFADSVVGLSGAALTNASLAIFGGGALATGGMGMAGGSIVIAGGGALAGLAGGAGAQFASRAFLSITENEVIVSCAKFLTFCDSIVRSEKKASVIIKFFIQQFEFRGSELSKELQAFNDKKFEIPKENQEISSIIKKQIMCYGKSVELLKKMI